MSDKKDDEIGDSDKDSPTNGVEAKEGDEPKEIDEAIPDMNNESMEVDEETEAESKERDKKDDKSEKSEAKENNVAIPGLPSGNGKPSKISIIK